MALLRYRDFIPHVYYRCPYKMRQYGKSASARTRERYPALDDVTMSETSRLAENAMQSHTAFFSCESKLLISTHYEMTRKLEVTMTQGMKRSAVRTSVCELQLTVAQCEAHLQLCYTSGDRPRATAGNHTHLLSSPRFIPTLSSYLLVDLPSGFSP